MQVRITNSARIHAATLFGNCQFVQAYTHMHTHMHTHTGARTHAKQRQVGSSENDNASDDERVNASETLHSGGQPCV
jgi:hypothetical protein